VVVSTIDVSPTRDGLTRRLREHLPETTDLATIRFMTQTAEQQLRSFIAKFERNLGKQIRECRSELRKRFPAANDLYMTITTSS
jgi:hypothetical protein